jgi:NAD(P)H-hydrate epimerase
MSTSRVKRARALGRDEVRAVDRRAVETYSIPSLILMENAGAGLSRSVEAKLRELGRLERGPVAIVCGKGGNGGDGLVLARHLHLAGHAPRIAIAHAPEDFDRASDAGVNLTIVERLGLPLEVAPDGASLGRLLARWSDAVLVADALLGTGVREPVREPYTDLIAALNACLRPIVAVDVPSGLDSDRGVPLGTAVRARWTVTFAALKKGFLVPGADEWTGPVEVVGIGAPVE